MSTVLVRKSVWVGLTALQQGVVKRVAARLDLGSGAEGLIAGVAWLAFDDGRMDLLDMAVLGVIGANLGVLPDTTNATPAQIRSAIQAFIVGKIVLPGAIDYTGQANPWQWTLTAQGAPASVKAADSPATVGWVAN